MQVMPGRTGISGFKEVQFFELDEQTQEKIKQKVFETHPEIHIDATPAVATTPKPGRKYSAPPAQTTATTPAPKGR